MSVAVITPTAWAKKYTSGNYEYKITDKGTVTITRYIGKENNINIPSKIDGHKVTKLGEYSFESVRKINSMKIPDTVLEIGRNAIGYTKKITLGKNVKKINSSAFSSAGRLTSIVVPKANKNYKVKSGVLYNKNMTKLLVYPDDKKGTAFTVPKKVKTIASNAFDYNKNLKSIKFSKSVKTIGSAAISDCEELKTITIPKNILLIGEYAFYNCEEVTKIKIDANKKLKILTAAFMNCESLKRIDVPKVSGKAVFSGCEDLKKIVIKSNVKTLTQNEFFECTKLKTVTVPDTVKKIEKQSLGYCDDGYCNTIKIEDFKIKGYKGSAAERYAKRNGFKFIKIA